MCRVALVNLGPLRPGLAEMVAAGIRHGLGCQVTISPDHLTLEGHYDTLRDQYRSTAMLTVLAARSVDGTSRVLGLTAVDLFIPVLTFVFGEAHLSGTAAVVSSRRLDPAAYGLPSDASRTAARVAKEAIHELGHTFGLRHCHDFACVMRSSGNVGQVDAKAHGFCPQCAGELVVAGLQPAIRRP